MTRAAIRVFTLFLKDLKDAIRDARVLIALIVPLGIGVFYNYAFEDTSVDTLTGKVAISAADQTALPSLIAQVLTPNLKVTFVESGDRAAVEEMVGNEDAELGIVVPAGFDDAVRSGEQPVLEVVRLADPSLVGDYVLASLDPVLRGMAGQSLPARITLIQAKQQSDSGVLGTVGLRTWSLILAIMMMLALISALAIPIVLAEEFEKKTIDALVLAMPYREVIAAKAGLGLFYIVVMTAVFYLLTDLNIHNWGLFIGAVALTGISLLGFGLLLAGLLKNPNQLNTWSGIFLIPFIAPATIVGQPTPGLLKTAAEMFPSGAGMQLSLNAVTGEQLFDNEWRAIVVLLCWTVVSNLLLLWQLKRRQA